MFLSLPYAFGLDISDTALKLIWLGNRGEKIFVKSFGSIPIPGDMIYRGEIRHLGDVADLIKKLTKNVNGQKLRSNRVIANLPETRTFIKVLEIPPTPENDLSDFLKKEVENHFPVSADEIYLKWEKLETTTKEKISVLVGVAPQKVVDDYLKLLELAGLVPIALEIEALAIARSLIALRERNKANGAKIILDMGANRSSLIIYDHHTVQFSLSLPFSGRQITHEISQTLKLDLEQAEQIKIMCGLDETRCQGALRELITAILNELVSRARDSLEYYYDNFSDARAVDQVIICGGGAKLIGLSEHLSKLLKLPVAVANPFINFNLSKHWQLDGFPVPDSLSYTTAIGLALKEFLS